MSAERPARLAAAGVAVALLAIAVVAMLPNRQMAAGSPIAWAEIAPPAEVAMRPWRWLVFSARDHRAAHFSIAAAPGAAARIERLPAWLLQHPVANAPEDALVVAIHGRAESADELIAALAATLARNLPSLPIRHIGADRFAPPPGFDQDRLRFRVRERLAAGSAP